jgi:hypothetical protein
MLWMTEPLGTGARHFSKFDIFYYSLIPSSYRTKFWQSKDLLIRQQKVALVQIGIHHFDILSDGG